MCRPFLIIIKSCYFNCRINKPFACTRCSVFLSLFTLSRRITRAKDHRPFYLNYQQINGGRNSDHMLSVLPRLQRSNTSVLQAMMRIIPFLTFGDERNMRTLINHFLPFLDFEKYVRAWPLARHVSSLCVLSWSPPLGAWTRDVTSCLDQTRAHKVVWGQNKNNKKNQNEANTCC